MSTRATVAKRNADGSYVSIYTNWDGVPEHHLPILKGYYNDIQRVDFLLELGDLSILGKDIGFKQDFAKPKKDMCLAYGRDRGEPGTEVKHHNNYSKFKLDREGVDHGYVFDVVTQSWSQVW